MTIIYKIGILIYALGVKVTSLFNKKAKLFVAGRKNWQTKLQNQVEKHQPDCIVLDYVGHPHRIVARLRRAVRLPVLDLGQLAIATLASIL